MELHGMGSAVARVAGMAAVAGGAVVCTKLLVAMALATVTISALGALLTAAGVGAVVVSGWAVAKAVAQRMRGPDPKAEVEQQETVCDPGPRDSTAPADDVPGEKSASFVEPPTVSGLDVFEMQFPQHLSCDLSGLRVGAMLYWMKRHMEWNPLERTALAEGPLFRGALSVQRDWAGEERSPQEMLAQARLGAGSGSPTPWSISGVDSVVAQLPSNSQQGLLVWFENRLPTLAIVQIRNGYEVFDPTRGSWLVPAQQMKCFLESYSRLYVEGKDPVSMWSLIRN